MGATQDQQPAASAGPPSLRAAASAATAAAPAAVSPDHAKGLDDGATGSTTTSKLGSKRRLFGFGKKKDEGKQDKSTAPAPAPTSSPPSAAVNATTPAKPSHAHPPEPLQLSPSPQRSPRAMASPGQRYRSSSPRLHSPASSQIFERNVQDNTSLAGELSPAIPSHIQTEDYIPPVLEASSLAITDDHLNPDEVEIVMSSAHQPAAAVVAGGSIHESNVTSPAPLEEVASMSQHSHGDVEESASNYGSIDNADPRRLSFISFADVVQAEQAENNRDALHLLSMSSSPAANRSPSPVRSPSSSHGVSASPPASGAHSVRGSDAVSLQALKAPGSPTASGTHSPPLGGSEITIETMRQALRKTGSGDLSGVRSQPLSAVSLEDSADRPPFR